MAVWPWCAEATGPRAWQGSVGHAAEAVGSGATRVCSRAAPPGEGAASPGKVQILAISSISLWQRNVCKYIFKGGFCFKNLNEQVCRVVLMRGVGTGLRSYPGPCDLQLPTTWLLGADQESAARVLRQVSTSSGRLLRPCRAGVVPPLVGMTGHVLRC